MNRKMCIRECTVDKISAHPHASSKKFEEAVSHILPGEEPIEHYRCKDCRRRIRLLSVSMVWLHEHVGLKIKSPLAAGKIGKKQPLRKP
jgi:hypothetical protein